MKLLRKIKCWLGWHEILKTKYTLYYSEYEIMQKRMDSTYINDVSWIDWVHECKHCGRRL